MPDSSLQASEVFAGDGSSPTRAAREIPWLECSDPVASGYEDLHRRMQTNPYRPVPQEPPLEDWGETPSGAPLAILVALLALLIALSIPRERSLDDGPRGQPTHNAGGHGHGGGHR